MLGFIASSLICSELGAGSDWIDWVNADAVHNRTPIPYHRDKSAGLVLDGGMQRLYLRVHEETGIW